MFTKKQFSVKDRIFAEVYLPESGDTFPCVIMSHGYNSSMDDLTDAAEKLADNGFAALRFDYCGGSTRSKSVGRSVDMSIATEINDIRDVIEFVRNAGFCNGTLFLYGESMGGYVSVLTAAEDKNIAGLGLLYPALCIPEDWTKIEFPSETIELMGMELSRKFRDEIPVEPINDTLKKISCPVYIFHGDADGLVNIEYSRKAADVIEECSMMEFPGEGHGFTGEARQVMSEELVGFFGSLTEADLA